MKLLRSHGFIILTLTAAVVIFFLWLGGYFVTEKRNRYLVPRQFTGWLCVNYGVPSEPPLPIDSEGFSIVKFSSSGIVRTSSLGKSGRLVDRYFYFHEGSKTEVPESNFGGGGTYSDPRLPEGHFASYFFG
jgi:hypothetical protein